VARPDPSTSTDLSGRAVVVTGGGTGIGRGIVRAMARAGAAVVVAGRTPEPLEASAEEARGLGAVAHVVPTDITRPGDIEALVAHTENEFGRIGCWVNNAGSARAQDVGPLIDLTEAQWDAVVDLNLKWTFFASQAAARSMARAGGGSIVNISSRSGSYPCPNTGQYGAAKAGIDSLTATMAAEWGHLGIRVNAIAPGVVVTETSEGRMTPSRRRRQIQTVPLQRLGTPDDVGPLCAFLASDASSWQTGTVTQLNGGSPIPVGYLTYLHHVNADVE
jgi:NAD(P)-dependent dehydrogenase (short-subunit alcohol dehydrogenase family)